MATCTNGVNASIDGAHPGYAKWVFSAPIRNGLKSRREDLVHLVCRQLPLFHHDLCGCRPRSEKDERAPSMRVVGEEWRIQRVVGEEWRFYPFWSQRAHRPQQCEGPRIRWGKHPVRKTRMQVSTLSTRCGRNEKCPEQTGAKDAKMKVVGHILCVPVNHS